uniref:DDE Tnp4 domain-containing protein n=1 Tax=Stegastes partitus TaxID=144197 RepID=A0A3B4Z979_9TELE
MVKMDYLDYINDAERPPPRPERRLLRDRINPFLCGVSESTDCKIVHKVGKATCELRKDDINFPDAADQATYKVQSYKYGNFPGVIGCVDGSIQVKNVFLINVQGVCTPTMQFSNIVAHWSASTRDSRIFQNSALCAQFEAGQHSGILLGDSGYAQTNFLFIPYLHPVRPEQQRYNQAHIHTRGLVQCICCIVIVATAVLHNYLRQHGSPDPPPEYSMTDKFLLILSKLKTFLTCWGHVSLKQTNVCV